MEMHPGQDPGRMVHVQVVVAETQQMGGPLGDLLRHVHERSRLQVKGRIRLVARDAHILAELVPLSSDLVHTAY